MKTDVYQMVTDRIIAAIERDGALPWVKPWSELGDSTPRNGVTGRPYNGINRLLLGLFSSVYSSPDWYTYKGAQGVGGSVRKGEKGTQIIYWHIVRTKDENGVEDSFPLLKYFTVFNRQQCDGLPDPKAAPDPEPFEAISHAERFVASVGAVIRHEGSTACYIPDHDLIRLPRPEAFRDPASYYATAFHELVHWTGHGSRLNRLSKARFGSPEYAFEELVAELGAAYLCENHKINGETQHPQYVAGWLKALKDDKKMIFKASGLATKAVGYMTGEGSDSEAQAA